MTSNVLKVLATTAFAALLPVSQTTLAEARWISVVEGQNRTYVYAQLNVDDLVDGASDPAVRQSINRFDTVRARVRVNQPISDAFAEGDGSLERALTTRQHESFARSLAQVSAVRLKHGIRWAPYVFLDLEYERNGRSAPWREDLFCENDSCKLSNARFSQLFEFIYRRFRGGNAAAGAVPANCRGCVISVAAPNASPADSARADLKLLLAPELLDASWCSGCDLPAVSIGGPAGGLKSYLDRLHEQRKQGPRQAAEFVRSSLGGKTFRGYDTTSEGRAKVVLMDAAAAADKLGSWRGVRVFGSVADSDMTYLFVTWSSQATVEGVGELWIVPVDANGRAFAPSRGPAAAFLDDPAVLQAFRELFAARIQRVAAGTGAGA